MLLTVRQAETNDIPELCALLEILFSIEEDFTADSRKQRRGLELLINSGQALVLTARYGDRIVGMVTVQILISTAEGGKVGLVEDLVIAPEFRGRAVGSVLMDRVMEWAHDYHLTRLQLLADTNNHPALAFYRATNWSTTQLIVLRTRPD